MAERGSGLSASSGTRAVILGEGAERTGVANGLFLGDSGLDAEGGQAGAVAEVEEDPRVAGAQVDAQDLRPGQPSGAGEIDHGHPVVVGDDLGAAEQRQDGEEEQRGEDEADPLPRAQLLQASGR